MRSRLAGNKILHTYIYSTFGTKRRMPARSHKTTERPSMLFNQAPPTFNPRPIQFSHAEPNLRCVGDFPIAAVAAAAATLALLIKVRQIVEIHDAHAHSIKSLSNSITTIPYTHTHTHPYKALVCQRALSDYEREEPILPTQIKTLSSV